MAMQPIDLQTLFTQMDKVGKNQSQMKEGLQIQATLQQTESQKKAEEHVREINEAQDMGYGSSKIKDENTRRGAQDSGKQKNESGDSEKEEAAEDKSRQLRDPALGRNIDISG